MMLAADEAFTKTYGLAATFVGIGILVTIILVYIAIQIRGEHRQNEEYLASRRPPGASNGFTPDD